MDTLDFLSEVFIITAINNQLNQPKMDTGEYLTAMFVIYFLQKWGRINHRVEGATNA